MSKIIFEDFFNTSNGQAFTYNNKEIVLADRIHLSDNKVEIKITFVSADSEWKQDIVLQTKGEFEINGQRLPNKIVLWEHTAPKEVHLLVRSKDKLLVIYNVWDTGDGTMHYGHNGGAINIEEVEGCKIYNCNDGFQMMTLMI